MRAKPIPFIVGWCFSSLVHFRLCDAYILWIVTYPYVQLNLLFNKRTHNEMWHHVFARTPAEWECERDIRAKSNVSDVFKETHNWSMPPIFPHLLLHRRFTGCNKVPKNTSSTLPTAFIRLSVFLGLELVRMWCRRPNGFRFNNAHGRRITLYTWTNMVLLISNILLSLGETKHTIKKRHRFKLATLNVFYTLVLSLLCRVY